MIGPRVAGIGLLAGGLVAILGIGRLAPELGAVDFDSLTGLDLPAGRDVPGGEPATGVDSVLQPPMTATLRALVDSAVATGDAVAALSIVGSASADWGDHPLVAEVRAACEAELADWSVASAEGADWPDSTDLDAAVAAVVVALGLDGSALHRIFLAASPAAGVDASAAHQVAEEDGIAAFELANRYARAPQRSRAAVRWQLAALRLGNRNARQPLVASLERIAPIAAWSIWRASQPAAPSVADWRRRAELARRADRPADELLAREAVLELEATVVDLRRAGELRAARGELRRAAEHFAAAAAASGSPADVAVAIDAWRRAGESELARALAVEQVRLRPTVEGWRSIAEADRAEGRLDRATAAMEQALQLAVAGSDAAARSQLERELAQLFVHTDRYEELLSLSAERLGRGAGNRAEWRQFVGLAVGLDRQSDAQRAAQELARVDAAHFLTVLPDLESMGGDAVAPLAQQAVAALPVAQLDSAARALLAVRQSQRFQSAIDRLVRRTVELPALGPGVRSLLEWQLLDRPAQTNRQVPLEPARAADETLAVARQCLTRLRRNQIGVDGGLLRTAARAARRFGDPQLETQLLDAVLRLDPDDVSTMEWAADALARAGEWARAVQRQRQALVARGVLQNGVVVRTDQDPESRRGLLRLVDWLLRTGAAREAERLVVQRAEHPGAAVADVLAAADLLLANGFVERSRYFYRRAHRADRTGARIARTPAHEPTAVGRALLGLARAAVAAGDQPEAVRWLQRAVRRDSVRRAAQVELARILRSTDPVRATRLARAAVTGGVLATAADRIVHANALAQIGRRTEALARLRRIVAAIDPASVARAERVSWRLDYAALLLEVGRSTAAEQQLDSVRALHPQNARLNQLAEQLADSARKPRRRGS